MNLIGDNKGNIVVVTFEGVSVPKPRGRNFTFQVKDKTYALNDLTGGMYACYEETFSGEKIAKGLLKMKTVDDALLVHRQFVGKRLASMVGRRMCIDKDNQEPFFKISKEEISYVKDILEFVGKNYINK